MIMVRLEINELTLKITELFDERDALVSPGGIVEREAFYRVLNKLSKQGN